MTAEWVSAIGTLVTAGATVGAVVVGAKGLSTWRAQRRAAVKQEAATKLLQAIEELADHVSDVRLHYSAAGKIQAARQGRLGPRRLEGDEGLQARVFISSELTRRGTAIHEANIRALKELASASLILGFEVDGGPASKLSAMAQELWGALSSASSHVTAGRREPLDLTDWTAGLPQEEIALFSYSGPNDDFFGSWNTHRRELHDLLRPFLLQGG